MITIYFSITAKKRFYANVDVISSGNQYEITIDSKKLKTPAGNVFTVNSEPIALAVAQEWSAQKELIMLSQMHLTGMSNVCIDNPTKTTKYALVDDILNFLDTDTILFFSDVSIFSYNKVKKVEKSKLVGFCITNGAL